MMSKFALRFATVAVAATVLAGSLVPAAAGETWTAVMAEYKPIQSISMTLGSKQLAGYFQTVDGACKTTLFVADAGDIYGAPMKISMDVGAARMSSIDIDGVKAMLVGCSADADQLTVATVDLPRSPNQRTADRLLTSAISAISN